MSDYQKMYSVLFNEISKTIELLQKAQAETEEIYISSPEIILSFVPKPKEDD